MDQGLAAVLGAGVGVIGTLGTACLTYLATRRQVWDQGKVELGHRLREERRQVYLDFLSLHEKMQRALAAMTPHSGRGSFSDFPSASDLSEGLDRLGALESDLHALYDLKTRIELIGPDAMFPHARSLFGAIYEIDRLLKRLYSEEGLSTDSRWQEVVELFTQLNRDRIAFVNACRQVLVPD
ncbi:MULTISPECIES: hypothetical protein [unclassified Streptomyces]|uniref:hypothetical protein n=1 Tax=unclassified Streptomyces TaxID=2593676 RepID=UPI001319E9FB|nr:MULTISPECIES: hypothetical protein [unclassified Streptomyces]MYX36738.1 hypothetical protein [Streptomyces sp. SID8377]